MTQKKVLVVEDEKDIKDLMALHLARDKYEVDATQNGEEARRLLRQNKYDLLVLDWMLPGMSGLDLCKEIRLGKTGTPQIPLLMVTARTNEADIILGLEMGADDYLTKPFEIPLFMARVRALLRRAQVLKDEELSQRELKVGDLVIDLENYIVRTHGEEILLTPSEFKLLAALMKNEGRVLTRQRLIDLVQGEGVIVVDRAIDTHVFGLRKKLGESADLIETIRGIGYRIKAP